MNRDRFYLVREAILIELVLNHVGKENAVHSSVFEKRYCISGRTVREMINQLRCMEGQPVCSCSKGYFFPKTKAEKDETVARMHAFSSSFAHIRNSLEEVYRPSFMNLFSGGYYDVDEDELPFT